jgi:hypothetical protein
MEELLSALDELRIYKAMNCREYVYFNLAQYLLQTDIQ